MKLLHLADLHIGKRVNGFPMLEDQRYILREILDIIKKQQTQAVLIAGDVYDKAVPSAEAVRLLDSFLTELSHLGQKVFMISGNHDSAERIAFGANVMKRADVYVSPVFDGEVDPVILKDAYGEVCVYMLPYIKPALVRAIAYERAESGQNQNQDQDKLQNKDQEHDQNQVITSYEEAVSHVLSQVQIDKTKRNIILSHQFLTGARPSESEEFSIGGVENVSASLYKDFDYVALGHIHRAQKVSQENIRYAGTPLKYSFSESSHVKSVTIVELAGKGNMKIEQIELHPLRDMREIKGTYEQITARDRYSQENTEDYVHITLTDEEDILDVVNRLRIIYPNLMRLDYDNTRTKENRAIMGERSVTLRSPMKLFADFYEMQNNQPMSEEQYAFAEKLLHKIDWRTGDKSGDKTGDKTGGQR